MSRLPLATDLMLITFGWSSNRRLVGEGKEEATYAEPVLLDSKNNSNLNNMNMLPQVNHQPDHHQETTMFHFAQPYGRSDLYR